MPEHKTNTPNQLSPKVLYEAFLKNNIAYFCGVPDSSLSSFGFYLNEHSKDTHDIAVNEGSAIALAVGYHLATSKVPLVYMQNSGIGNAINPLTSIVDPSVFGIPMILLIGWRGQPGKKDEPQHKKQGEITTKLLSDLGIPYAIMSAQDNDAQKQVAHAVGAAKVSQQPFALIVENGSLEVYKHANRIGKHNSLTREDAITRIIGSMDKLGIVVATTGKASRELFEHRKNSGQSHASDLLVVGAMGHASTIAAAIAKNKPRRKVYCIDGDGAILMHMGCLPAIGHMKVMNYYHFVINNGCHESVGGQPTVAFDIDLPSIAKASGYTRVYSVGDQSSLAHLLKSIKKVTGSVFIEVRTNTQSRSDLGRPSLRPAENKKLFMAFLEGN